jgi:hypothetical protein
MKLKYSIRGPKTAFISMTLARRTGVRTEPRNMQAAPVRVFDRSEQNGFG